MPFPYKKIAMLVGGTGISPVIQVLHANLGETDGSSPVVTVLYGSRVQEDILANALLQEWAKNYTENFTVVNVLSEEPEDSTWKGVRGHPNKALIEEHFPKPDEEDIQIFICGPPPMYNALSGPHGDKELGGLLKEMGYSAEQVYKF
jgi:cytochrome-b5 reductase